MAGSGADEGAGGEDGVGAGAAADGDGEGEVGAGAGGVAGGGDEGALLSIGSYTSAMTSTALLARAAQLEPSTRRSAFIPGPLKLMVSDQFRD